MNKQETRNLAEVSDTFKCEKCLIFLEDFSKVVIDEDDGYTYHYVYFPKYCPECGRKVIE